MKMTPASHRCRLAALFLSMPSLLFAADYYVSASGTYDGIECDSDLQQAIDKAATGDTVWVEDGFVCSEGRNGNEGEGFCRIRVVTGITLRSRSGTKDHPVVICGQWESADAPLGDQAIRCVTMTHDKAKLIGFRLEGGATRESPSEKSQGDPFRGGGFLGCGVISNCVITGNEATFGGGIASRGVNQVKVYSSVIEDNGALYSSGGIRGGFCYFSEIVGNRSEKDSGGFRWTTFEDCLIANNHSETTGGAGISTGQTLTRCVITNNVSALGNGGALGFMPVLDNCLIGWNRSGGKGGGVAGGAYTSRAIATNCTFIGNVADSYGGGASCITAVNCLFTNNFTRANGGGASESFLTNSIVIANTASNTTWGTGCGGGLFEGEAFDTLIAGNEAQSSGKLSPGIGCGGGAKGMNRIVNCTITNNTSYSRAGGTHYCTAINSMIIGNRAGTDGGGALGGSYYNTLLLGNEAAAGSGGAAWEVDLYNCTVMGNKGTSNGGIGCRAILNTVVWDNFPLKNAVVSSTNSIGSCCTEDKGPGNRNVDPKILTTGKEAFLPAPGSPCLNKGLFRPWMTDPADLRSRDRNGRPRILASAVDIGALEAPFYGTTIFMR